MSGFNRSSKLREGDFYTTPEGFLVFTEQYLLRRGYCCQNGCRHCPYGFKHGSMPKKKGFNG
ncbi:MAG: DUF5522 domain-containing protein [Bacteroidota bacterium]